MLQFACSGGIFSRLLRIYRLIRFCFKNDFVRLHLEQVARALLDVTPGLSWK